jgi:methylmalonyl-CoA carboxyltransferase large subunit
MESDNAHLVQVIEALRTLRQDLNSLSERVAALEEGASEKVRPDAAAEGAGGLAEEELVAVISAAVAAYLGVKPHVRQIRLLGAASWAQQGRVTIQASHALELQHG